MDGRRLVFHCNAFRTFVFSLAALFGLCYLGLIDATMLVREFWGILLWANTTAIALSLFLFIKGRLWAGHTSGSVVRDFVMGTELAPRVAGLTINFFWIRPSMMLWMLINLSALGTPI